MGLSELLTIAMPLISKRGLTLIGIALTNLGDQSGVQLRLPFERGPELVRTARALQAESNALRAATRQLVTAAQRDRTAAQALRQDSPRRPHRTTVREGQET